MSSFRSSSQARGGDDGKNRFVHSSPVGPDSPSSHGNGRPNGSGNGSGNGLGGVATTSANDNPTGGVPSLRERAASQPPRGGDSHQTTLFSSPSTHHYIPSSMNNSPWTSHRIPFNSSSNTNSPGTNTNNSNNNNNNNGGGAGGPQPVPIRSSSYSTPFSSAIRGERARFPSTFEDDEPSELDDPISSTPSDRYGIDDIYGNTVPPSLSRGRTTYGHDPSRSRAQSLATLPPRPAPPIGGGSSPSVSSSYLRTPTMQSWNESLLSSFGSPPSTTTSRYDQGRYGEMIAGNNARNAATSRYASLGTDRVSSSRIHDPFSFFSSSPSPSSGGAGANDHDRYTDPSSRNLNINTAASSFPNRYHDISNVSPFVRDVDEILLDNSGLDSLWARMQRDEAAGTGIGGGLRSGTTSGTTSRRHSVSVVQPRTRGGNNIVGFNAPGSVDSDESAVNSRTSHLFHHHHQYPSSVLGGSGSSAPYFGSVGSGSSGVSSGGGAGGSSGGGSAGLGGLGNPGGRSLLLTDEDLADNLGLLNINPNDPPSSSTTSSIKFPPSQPSSLPIFGTSHSRSPVSARDTTSPYRGLGGGGANGGGNSYLTATAASLRQQRQQLSSPSDEYHPGHPGISESPQLFEPPQPQQLYSTEGVKPASPFINTHVAGYGASGDRGATSPLSPTSGGGASTTTSRLMVNPQQPPYYPQQRRVSETHGMTSPTSASSGTAPPSAQSPSVNLAEIGKGIPLHSVPSSCPLYIVEFKAGRTDLYYVQDQKMDVRVGDLVIVEADRGRDLGKVINEGITVREVEAWQRQQAEKAQAQANALSGMGMGVGPDGQPTSPVGANPPGKKEINPKRIYAKAGPHETQLLAAKTQDEQKALQLCQTKVRAKKLPMEVVDAEYQWDRRKLTFYFVAEKRIDFRELVRELFRLYKTRIWMASLQGPGGYEQ